MLIHYTQIFLYLTVLATASFSHVPAHAQVAGEGGPPMELTDLDTDLLTKLAGKFPGRILSVDSTTVAVRMRPGAPDATGRQQPEPDITYSNVILADPTRTQIFTERDTIYNCSDQKENRSTNINLRT